MKSLVAAAVHTEAAFRPSRRPLLRLLGLAPAGLLLCGLFMVWAGPLAGPVAATSGDWPQFHNDATHQGYNSAETTLSASNVGSLGLAWTATTGGYNSSLVVADGVVYLGSEDGKLYAYAVGCASGGGTCTPLWTATVGGNGTWMSTPAVANGVVYVGSSDDNLYAFDAAGVTGCSGSPKSCTPLWTAAAGGDLSYSPPTVANGVVYVGSYVWDHTLYAFDAAGVTGCSGSPKSCAPLWTATTGFAIDSSPTVANGVVYIGSNDGKLYAFDASGVTHCSGSPKTCTPLWTATTGAVTYYPAHSSPAVANGVVYIGSNDHTLYAFDAAGCSGINPCAPLWTATTGNAIDSSPAVANGVVYVGSNDGKLYAYAVGCASGGESCTPLWTATTGSVGSSSPAVANGVVYVGTSDGNLYAFDAAGVTGCGGSPKSCTPLWSAPIGVATSPAVANGVVYVSSSSMNSELYAFGFPAPTKTLAVSGIPSPTVAGVAHNVTVTAKDAHGNTATGYRGKVHFTSSDPAAVLPADYTFTAADAGTHTFSVTLKTAGARSVTATDTATASITGSQSAIVVNPAAATHLAVSGIPSPTVVGVAHNVTVKALDVYGNTVTGYTGTVHFTSSDGAALLPADAKLTSGVGTFSVTLRTPGTQSVTATDTVTASING